VKGKPVVYSKGSKLNRIRNSKAGRKFIIAATAFVALTAASGCGGSGTQTLTSTPPINSSTNAQTPVKKPEAGTFLASLIKTSILGQWERAYAWLDPSQQQKLSESAFVNYKQSVTGDSEYEFVSAKPVDQYSTTLDGQKMEAVTMKIVVKDSNGHQQTFTQTMHAIDQGDHWTWRMSADQWKEATTE